MNKLIIMLLFLSFFIFSKDSLERYYIKEFDFGKMLGTWYEIARKETMFENHLDYAKTKYILKDNGEVDIITTGFSTVKNRNIIIKGTGRKKYNEADNIFEAKFFALGYSDFIIIDYDRKDYKYMVIRGKNSDYFWILSRTSNLDKNIVKKLIRLGEADGIDMKKLIRVKQD